MTLPEITHCLLCEDSRAEANRKTTILGFMGVTPDVEVLVHDFRGGIDLNFFMVGSATDPSFELEPRILGANDEVIASFPKKVPIHAGARAAKSLQLAVGFKNTRFPGPGVYKFQAVFNGEKTYETSFRLAQGKPEEFERP